MRNVTAEEFKDLFNDHRQKVISDLIVTEDCELDLSTVETSKIHIENVVFNECLLLNKEPKYLNELSFSQCEFLKDNHSSLEIEAVKLKGELSLNDCQFKSRVYIIASEFDKISIVGDSVFNDDLLFGDISNSHIQISTGELTSFPLKGNCSCKTIGFYECSKNQIHLDNVDSKGLSFTNCKVSNVLIGRGSHSKLSLYRNEMDSFILDGLYNSEGLIIEEFSASGIINNGLYRLNNATIDELNLFR